MNITAQTDFRRVQGKYDTLLIAGGYGVLQVEKIPGFLPWLRKTANAARRIGSVCNGAFALAAAGLLDGKRATTHWYFCRQMAEQFPNVHFDPDPIFICDGNVYTSAGVTAGIDLSLALVEEDWGADVALLVARALVVFLRRPGSQSQFSVSLSLQTSDRTPLRELQVWLLDNLREPLTVEQMAERVGMSPNGPLRSAPVRSSWPLPDCSRDWRQRHIGLRGRICRYSARNRRLAVSFSKGRSLPRPVSRPGLIWH